MKKSIVISIVLILISFQVSSQVYSNKVVGDKNQEHADSIKKSGYPYALPIWGAKVTALGYDLPYSAGLGINYLYQKSDIIIEDLLVVLITDQCMTLTKSSDSTVPYRRHRH